MKTIALNKIEKTKVKMAGASGAWKQVPLSADDGAPVYAYRVFTIEPGGFTPFHAHDYEHMNYIIEGEGAIIKESGEELPVQGGDFAMVMPNEKHQYRNKSKDQPMVMICGVPKQFE